MNNNEINFSDKYCEFFGGNILMFLFASIFGNYLDIPEKIKNKVKEIQDKGEDIKEEDLEEIKPLIEDYYNKIKEEF